ncbi:C-type lectin domain family 11 member A [Latimeria chalumnae]|uniref:C-type lectin domain containing 11A n=1 Tax=Latimeria chalumnae TaxID=7897 RepID=H3AL74_LATCH|nr:PREDICTED: C-type lectin domain family 11 member A [Latimeria chalumnae]|eukprot:XP_005990975.1 PREDICTED: C-type lectin domain family 11 member A [Latimeria chalumnae]
MMLEKNPHFPTLLCICLLHAVVSEEAGGGPGAGAERKATKGEESLSGVQPDGMTEIKVFSEIMDRGTLSDEHSNRTSADREGEGGPLEQEDIPSEEEEGEEEEVNPSERELMPSQPDDNFSYILSRLALIDATIQKLHVQYHGMDSRVVKLTETVSKLTYRVTETRNEFETLSEANQKIQKDIGKIEGCMKGLRILKKCFLLFQRFEDFDTAGGLCRGRGGALAMPRTEEEFLTVAQYTKVALSGVNWPVWIGITDHRAEGLYLYEDGHRVSFFRWFRDFLVTQPNGGKQENCVSFSSEDGKWWDNDCARRMYFLCEYEFSA